MADSCSSSLSTSSSSSSSSSCSSSSCSVGAESTCASALRPAKRLSVEALLDGLILRSRTGALGWPCTLRAALFGDDDSGDADCATEDGMLRACDDPVPETAWRDGFWNCYKKQGLKQRSSSQSFKIPCRSVRAHGASSLRAASAAASSSWPHRPPWPAMDQGRYA